MIRMTVTRPRLALKDKGWWRDICEHQAALLLWLGLNLLDFILTAVGMSLGRQEINPLIPHSSLLAFGLQKFILTILAVAWLALWKWTRFLKWLNWLFGAVVLSNVVDLLISV